MKTLIATALLAASFCASAHQYSAGDVADLPVYEVATIESNDGEGLDPFAKRVGEVMRKYTHDNGVEACAMIGVGGAHSFSVRIVTIKSQVVCAPGGLLPGYSNMNLSIHSHPEATRVRLTALDMKARGTPAGKLRMESLKNCEFSSADYQTSGYLVACGKLFKQSGKGTEQEVL